MSHGAPGRRAALAAGLALWAGSAAAGTLLVEGADGPLLSLSAPEGAEWCLRWNHSVTGGPVADCFVNSKGRMVLDHSYLHDYAAGLGDVPGRGRVHAAAGGGYEIDDIDEPVPDNALILRVGRPSVDHRLEIGGETFDLSALAANRRVTLRLVP
ncbi:MAG: DUF1850 domain-containing protein [Tranquillimonas sp.]